MAFLYFPLLSLSPFNMFSARVLEPRNSTTYTNIEHKNVLRSVPNKISFHYHLFSPYLYIYSEPALRYYVLPYGRTGTRTCIKQEKIRKVAVLDTCATSVHITYRRSPYAIPYVSNHDADPIVNFLSCPRAPFRY